MARVGRTSVDQLIVDLLASEIERVRADKNFTGRARKLLERDKELLDRLARRLATRSWSPRSGVGHDRMTTSYSSSSM